MPRARRIVTALTGICFVLVVFGSCGGSPAIVRISGASNTSISEATLDHWMKSMAGADFRQGIGAQGPRGLVSEPADYRRCIVAAKLIVPRSFFNQLKLSKTYLDERCHELHRAIKAQTLSFLISTQWAIIEGAERGIGVSDGEVKRALERLQTRAYPTDHALRAYLAARQWSLSDLIYQLKRALLVDKLQPQPDTTIENVGVEQIYSLPIAPRRLSVLRARTRCAPADAIALCRVSRAITATSPSPESVLIHLVRGL